MKMKPSSFWVLAAVATAGIVITPLANSYADEPDPLALPCTIGAKAQVVNPYSKVLETYECQKCGSETCWIVQPQK
jgi:hypothetical protein